MKVYITGSSGLVASRFVELFGDKFSLLTPEVEEVDITSKENLFDYFKNKPLDAIVNFAAFTDVSLAESQRGDKSGLCWKVNVEGVSNLIDLAKQKKAEFIQISTDYVFPGSKDYAGPYKETDSPLDDSDRLTWYGFTKAEAERLIGENLGNNATILRINYPVRARFERKLDFLRKPLKLFDEEKLYPLFYDQQVSISFIDEVAGVLSIILERKVKGIYHASSSDVSSPYELVSYLLEKTRGKKNVVQSSSVWDFIRKQKETNPDNPFVEVRYPIYGGLSVSKTEELLGVKFSTCRQVIDKLVEQGIGD